MLDFTVTDQVAVIKLDDGKANAVGHGFVDAINEGLDRAQAEAQAVLLVGREGVFSAGFDLKEFEKGPEATTALVNKGADMLLRIFTHPQPVVAACTGHAVAAGAFTMLASDTRIGSSGNFKIGLNETAIGMSLPVFGLQLAAARLSRRWQTRCVVQGDLLGPEDACDAGFLDRLTDPQAVESTALDEAQRLAQLPGEAYAANKLANREPFIQAIRASLPM